MNSVQMNRRHETLAPQKYQTNFYTPRKTPRCKYPCTQSTWRNDIFDMFDEPARK